MQNDFLAAGAPLEVAAGRAMVPTLKRVIEFCRDRHIRAIYTARGTENLGDASNAFMDAGLRTMMTRGRCVPNG